MDDKELEYISFTNGDLIGLFSMWAYMQCPNNEPRNIQNILTELKKFIKKDFEQPLKHDATFLIKEIEKDKLYNYIYNMLCGIQAFREWNLSYEEVQKGISVNDERCEFSFHSAYDVISDESWKNDFVDLDAFVNNLTRSIFQKNYYDSIDDEKFVNENRKHYAVRNCENNK